MLPKTKSHIFIDRVKLRSHMKIALIGAGAVGGYFIWGMENSDRDDRKFTVIAEGDRKKRLAEKGIKVNGTVYHPHVATPEEAGAQDVIIFSVKGGATVTAAKMLPPLIGEKTVVLSMLNGADSEEIIADTIGSEHVLHSIIMIASRRFDDEIVFDTSYNTTVKYGAADIPDAQEKLAMVEDAVSDTGLHFVKSDDIMLDIWTKYAKNISNNLPQAVLGVPAALYTRSDHGLFLAKKLWAEVRVLARIRGVELPEEVGIYECADSSRYSTLQDLDAGRTTEIESLCGYLLKMASENDIPVPYIEYTYHAIKALEEKNAGVFEC